MSEDIQYLFSKMAFFLSSAYIFTHLLMFPSGNKQPTDSIYSQTQVDPSREESILCEYLFF